MNKDKILEFKAKLARNDIKLIDFCHEHGLHYNTFIQKINGFRELDDDTAAIMSKYLETDNAKQ